jgi:hypothetical protein
MAPLHARRSAGSRSGTTAALAPRLEPARPSRASWSGIAFASTLVTCVALATTSGCRSPSDVFPEAGVPLPLTCIGTCAPDPGPKALSVADCQAEEAGLEFLPVPGWDFEGGLGNNMYVYTDQTTANIFSYVDATQPDYSQRTGWQPNAARLKRCGDADPGNYVMHIAGGPYRAFGGGMGVSFSKFHGLGQLCPVVPDSALPEYCPPTAATFQFQTLDLSRWDGISLWARRGPDGQAAIRVGLGDTDTDDDISYLTSTVDATKPRQCERNLECACNNHLPCTDYQGTSYCWDPKLSDRPILDDDANALWMNQHELVLPASKCGQSRCDDIYAAAQAPDPIFNGHACSYYAYPFGEASLWCFDPGKDHVPYSSIDTCGDHWVFPVNLTTDWHLYLVPFTELSQQGFGKKFAKPLLSQASLLRLMWDVGWLDYWIDDVRFYRIKKN